MGPLEAKVIPKSQSHLLGEGRWGKVGSEDDSDCWNSKKVAEYACHAVLMAVLELVSGVDGGELQVSEGKTYNAACTGSAAHVQVGIVRDGLVRYVILCGSGENWFQ